MLRKAKPTVLYGLFLLCSAPLLHAQPWVGPRGETTVTITYERTEHEGHVLNSGQWLRAGGSHASALHIGIEHSLTDRLAVSFGMPYVAAKFARNNGPNMTLMCPTCPGLDDGNYHSTWQDVTVGARYNVLTHPAVITPSISLRVPSHSYATAFEAAPGRHLAELQTALAAGRVFELRGQPLYVSGQYGYTFAQRLLGVSTNRSNADLTLGAVVTPALTAHAFIDWQETHGGLTSDFVLNFDNKVEHPALYRSHDGLIRDDFWRGGVGVGYALTPRISVQTSIATLLTGTDTHYGYLYSVSVSRAFGP